MPDLLQRAAALYARGNLAGAEASCRQLLQLHPDQADALHILGLVAWRRGDRQQALSDIKNAIASDPRKPQTHNSLGVLFKEAGNLSGAEAAFRAAIALRPNYPDALTNLGNVLCESGRLADAEAMHRRVVELAANYAEGHNNLATALASQERWDEAVEECRLAVGLEPTRAEFQLNLGNALLALRAWKDAAQAFQRAVELDPGNADAHANLGIVLYYLDEPEKAAAAHRHATELRPDAVQFWINLAAAQIDLDDADAGLESCQRALALDCASPDAYNCLGLALKVKGASAGAVEAYRTAIRMRPSDHRFHSNLGNVFHTQGRFEEALAAYATALKLEPEYKEAQSNLGMLQLLLGEFESGWGGYEQGLDKKRPRVRSRYQDVTSWDGTPAAGKTIVVWAEQGIGDQIMFGSMLPDLVERGATCLVDLDNRLYPLLRRSIRGLTPIPIDGATPEPIAADYQVPIGSLCRWLRPNLTSFPSRGGYLKADPVRVEELRRRYRERFGNRSLVGISWRGGTGDVGRIRSIPLTMWAPILTQSEIGFVNLQYGDCRADLEDIRRKFNVEILHDDEIDPLVDLDGFAAQTAAVDLVVSIDNSTVHLAGALNIPVWILLPLVPDWRWLLERSDSPWHASARLFRQTNLGDWSFVIAAVADELRQTMCNKKRLRDNQPDPGRP